MIVVAPPTWPNAETNGLFRVSITAETPPAPGLAPVKALRGVPIGGTLRADMVHSSAWANERFSSREENSTLPHTHLSSASERLSSREDNSTRPAAGVGGCSIVRVHIISPSPVRLVFQPAPGARPRT